MKKRFSLLLLVLLSLLLTGCGSSTTRIKDIVDPEFIDFATKKREYAKPLTIETAAELDNSLSSNTIIGFNDKTFYNLEAKKFIVFDRMPAGEVDYRVRNQYIVMSTEQLHYIHNGKTGQYLFSIAKGDDVDVFFGNTIIYHDYKDEQGNDKSDKYVFTNYKYKKEEVVVEEDDAPDYDETHGQYGYIKIDNSKIKVFKDDKTYHMISFNDGYEIGYQVDDSPWTDRVDGWYILNNGNILIQRFKQVPNDFPTFHFIDDDVRFVMKSELFIVKSAILKSLDLDFVVDDVNNGGFYKAENLVELYQIDELTKEFQSEEYVFYDNEMKKAQRLEFKYGIMDVTNLDIAGENLFLYTDETTIYALDGSNKVKGEKHYDADDYWVNPLLNGLIEFEDKNTNLCSLYDILKDKVLYENLTDLVSGNQYALYQKEDGKIIIVSLYGIVETEYTNYRTYGGSCFKLYTDDENNFELFNIQGKSLGTFEGTTIQVISNNLGYGSEGYLAVRLEKGLEIKVLVYKVK